MDDPESMQSLSIDTKLPLSGHMGLQDTKELLAVKDRYFSKHTLLNIYLQKLKLFITQFWSYKCSLSKK